MSNQVYEKAYSIDGENFTFDSPDEAMQAMYDDERLIEGAVYYEIDIEDVVLADYLKADRILESANESLHDDIGEAAEYSFNPSREGHDELNALLAVWCEKHLSGERYWRCRGKDRELVVTAEDVANITVETP